MITRHKRKRISLPTAVLSIVVTALLAFGMMIIPLLCCFFVSWYWGFMYLGYLLIILLYNITLNNDEEEEDGLN